MIRLTALLGMAGCAAAAIDAMRWTNQRCKPYEPCEPCVALTF